MATIGGANNREVMLSDIAAVNTLNATIVTGETGNVGPGGTYQIKYYNNIGGCSSSGIFLQVKNDSSWTKITCELEFGGTASCWNFNNSYGPGGNNIATYDESLNDIIPEERCLNSWEIPAYQSHNKILACDNAANNFFRFDVKKTMLMRRHRDSTTSTAGISAGRACSTSGTGAYTIIRKIRIW